MYTLNFSFSRTNTMIGNGCSLLLLDRYLSFFQTTNEKNEISRPSSYNYLLDKITTSMNKIFDTSTRRERQATLSRIPFRENNSIQKSRLGCSISFFFLSMIEVVRHAMKISLILNNFKYLRHHKSLTIERLDDGDHKNSLSFIKK